MEMHKQLCKQEPNSRKSYVSPEHHIPSSVYVMYYYMIKVLPTSRCRISRNRKNGICQLILIGKIHEVILVIRQAMYSIRVSESTWYKLETPKLTYSLFHFCFLCIQKGSIINCMILVFSIICSTSIYQSLNSIEQLLLISCHLSISCLPTDLYKLL